MISATEAQQYANEAKKRIDRTAEVERMLDEGIRATVEHGELYVRVVVPEELKASIEPTLVRYRANGWFSRVQPGSGAEIVVELMVDAAKRPSFSGGNS